VSCIEQMKYDLLLERTSFKVAREFIEKNSDEVYYVEPGYKIFKDYYIIGVPPIAIGAKGDDLVFTYVKPCHGTFVMKIRSEEEIKRLRDREREKVMASLKKGMMAERPQKDKPADYRSVFK
jgi:hypothetical protein